VVKNIEPELMQALKQAFPTHPLYLQRQREAFAYAYHSEAETTAAERGAKAMADFLTLKAGRFSPSPSKKMDGGYI
jgi:hypothetical protein